ncbi:hypothetical protein [Bradyrhizobium sp.]|uniref:hypothetical protein n=1 Tax=Bradyrhizobium sp. TaxID=376 RepID=UPI003C43EA05
MRRTQRLIAAAVLIAFSGVLAGCSGGIGNWDPTDLLDFLDTKKKLPGDRKPVFPDGVPGLEQGVPKELYKGEVEQQQQQQDQQAAQAAAAAAQPQQPPPEEPKSKQAKKSRKPVDAANAAQDPSAGPNPDAAPDGEAAAPPKKKIVRKRTTAPPPDDQTAQPGQPTQQSSAPFPAPMPSGNFSR